MLHRSRLAVLALGALLSANASAGSCGCDVAADEIATVVDADSANGLHVRLKFAVDPVTTETHAATVCTSAAAKLTEAKLWMPDMEHGSGPTRVTVGSPTCTTVERLKFLMDGGWELRLTTADGDTATLAFEVAP